MCNLKVINNLDSYSIRERPDMAGTLREAASGQWSKRLDTVAARHIMDDRPIAIMTRSCVCVCVCVCVCLCLCVCPDEIIVQF